jgi:hypothetical protein
VQKRAILPFAEILWSVPLYQKLIDVDLALIKNPSILRKAESIQVP